MKYYITIYLKGGDWFHEGTSPEKMDLDFEKLHREYQDQMEAIQLYTIKGTRVDIIREVAYC